VPVGGGVGALGGALLGLISNPRLLVLLMAVFAGSAAGAVAGKLPWGDIGEIGGQVAGGLVGGIAWAAWLYFEGKKPVLPSRAATDLGRPSQRLQVIAFDLDVASMIALRHAVPEWAIKVVNGATAASLSNDWNPGAADFLVVQAGADAAETLGLCRFLAFCSLYSSDSRNALAETEGATSEGRDQAGRADAPLLVLAPRGHESFAKAAVQAGAHRCLMLPIDAKQVADMLLRFRSGDGAAPTRRRRLVRIRKAM